MDVFIVSLIALAMGYFSYRMGLRSIGFLMYYLVTVGHLADIHHKVINSAESRLSVKKEPTA